MTTRTKDVTFTVAILAASFSSLATALYVVSDQEPSVSAAFVLIFAPLLAVVLWLQKDAQRTGVGRVLDLGYFLLLAWPVVVPWYAFKTRGRSGWRLALGLFLLILSPYVVGITVGIVRWFFWPIVD